jgi:hypothetical protein
MSTRWHTFSNDHARVGCRHRPDLPLPSLVAGAYNRRRLLAPGPEDAAACPSRGGLMELLNAGAKPGYFVAGVGGNS